MHPNFDPVIFLNFILSLAIFIFGLIEYLKSKIDLALYICIAFGLLCIGYVLTIMGLETVLSFLVISFTPIAYMLVIFVLYRIWVRNKIS